MENKNTLEWKWMIEDLRKNYKELLWYFFASLLIIAFKINVLVHYTSEQLGIIKVASFLNVNIINTLLSISLLGLVIGYIFINKIYLLKLIPTLVSCIRSISIICIYLFVFRDSNIFYCFEDYPSIYYIDIFIFCISSFSLKLKPYQSFTSQTKSIFVEENTKITLANDSAQRGDYSKIIVEQVNNLKTENSFSIAIIGEWGSGKSTFMNFLEENLITDNRNIIIKYNPWKVKNTDLMLDDFFTSFINKVAEFDHDLKSSLIQYSQYLTESSLKDNWITKALTFFISNFHKPQSLAEQLGNINTQIEQTGKKFIIFIDDIDRLTGEEIFQILKLLRTTMDFKNVIFIAGIDLKYVYNSIEKSKSIYSINKYLNKIFQLEILLPPIDKYKLRDSLLNQLVVSEEHKKVISSLFNDFGEMPISSIPKEESAFNTCIDSFRDVNRFVNSFNLTYSIIGDFVEIRDLVFIELIKMKYPLVYQKIASKQYLFFYKSANSLGKNVHFYQVDYNEIANKHFGGKTEDIEYVKLTRLLISIYKEDNMSKYKSACMINKHQTYYNYLTIGLITDEDFADIWNQEIEEIIKIVKEYVKQNKQEDFYRKCQIFLPSINNLEIFEKFVLINLEIGEKNNQETIFDLIHRGGNIGYDYFDFIKSIVSNKILSLEKRIYFCSTYIQLIIRGGAFINKDLKKDYVELNFGFFEEFLEKQKEITYNLISIYRSNVEDSNEKGFLIYYKAAKLFREFIESHKEDYLKTLLHPYYNPNPADKRYVFEPLLNQTFQDKGKDNGFENFEIFLENFKGNEKLKNFTKKHFEQYKKSKAEPKYTTLDENEIIYLKKMQASL
ncbi:MAG: P-loop NTPase fold protein [Bacteroidota bacterium]